MNEKNKSERSLSQLGLPPMELAETNRNENSNNGFKRCLVPIIHKLLAIMVILLVTMGSYIILLTILQGFDSDRTPEIIIIEANQDTPNITLVQKNIEISFNFKNKTSHTVVKRQKRDVKETSSTDSVEMKVSNTILDDDILQKARDIVSNTDAPCDNQNKETICKYLVNEIQALNRNSHSINNLNDGQSVAREKNANSETKITFKETDSLDGEIKQISTSTEKAKRETNILDNFEMLEATPNIPFEGRNVYGYLPHPVLPPYPSAALPHLTGSSSCLFSRLLNHHANNVPYNIADYPPPTIPHYGARPIPYSRLVPPSMSPAQYFLNRETEAQRREIHPQDLEILMNFLKPLVDTHLSNSTKREAECIPGSISCSNGEGCVTASQWCDGNVDCSDVSDESSCSCRSRVDKSRLCDGYFDCPFGEDEMGCYGCDESMFSCQDLAMNPKSTCFTKEQRCNNVADCPNNRDEMDCTMLSPSLHKTALFAVSNTEGFLHRNFKGEWYAVCQNPYMWAHDACRRETGLIIRPPFIQVVPIDPLLKVNYLNTGHGGLIELTNSCFNSSAIYVTCPDLLCGTRIMSNAQILKQDGEAEMHLFGRNKRFLMNGHPYPLMFFNNRLKRYTAHLSHEPIENPLKTTVDFEGKQDEGDGLRNKRMESRVVGGRLSEPAAWPWIVAMNRDGMFHCGGVVLTQSWVISAAHCVSKFWEHYYEIQVGMLRRFSFSPQEQIHRVTHIIVNQFYNQADMKNDVSLLRVKPSILFSRWVRPVCLPGPETAGAEWLWGPPPGTLCTAVGWGATVEHGPDPDHLREVEVPIVSKCKHKEDKAGKEICAGIFEGGKDACQGDSGGPLLCRNPLNPQQWYMAGIVSHGDGCGRKGEPGVYTRVSLFVKWIRFHIFSESLPSLQPKQECPGFRCISGIAKCLSSKRMCDKIVDCLGGEDEVNCNTMRSSSSLNNLFLSTPLDTSLDHNIINEHFGKEAEPESDEAKDMSREANTNITSTSMNPLVLEDKTELDEDDKRFEFQHTSTNSPTVTVTEMDAASAKFNFSEESQTDVPFLNVTENDTAFEKEVNIDIYGSSTNIDIDMKTLTTSSIGNTDQSDRGDMEDSFSMSLAKETLKSMSSIAENRDADIEEDWTDTSTPPSILQSTTPTNEMSNTDEKFGLTTEIPLEKKGVTEAINVLETTDGSNHILNLSTIVSSENSEPESKDLLIDLPDSTETKLTPSHDTKLNTHADIVTRNDTLDESNSKILPDLQNNSIVDKIKDIIISKLEPARIKNKHRVPEEFDCRRIYQVIPHNLRCDRKPDCEDGTDELSCTCIDYISRFDKHLLCDGLFDCADGQDEIDCFDCAEDQFLCKRSRQCLPNKFVCDGKPHCPLGEDELECFALTNGKSIVIDFDGLPKVDLQGFLTKKHVNDWHVVCEENMSTEQQEAAAAHICHYLGFSSANRYFVKHINIREEDILRISSEEDTRKKRQLEDGIPVHFAYRKVEENSSRHIVIKEPEVLKEQCVPNVTKTCMSLYVHCDYNLYTHNLEQPNEILFNREANLKTHMWPWTAKIFIDGNYRCTGVLIDLSWALVSHSCLWDALLSHHHITVVLGSHRTLNSTKGMYEQTYQVDAKKDLYHSKAVLLHLKEPAHYSDKVKPMVLPPSNVQDVKPTICLAVGQDENNTTVGVFLQETNENCDLHSRCFLRTQKENVCAPGLKSHQHWAGIISCHSERGWYPAASFVDGRGECGIGDRITASEIGGFRNEIKRFIGQSISESKEVNVATECDGIRCGRGKCVKLDEVCDGVPNCEDQQDELEDACEMKTKICSKDPYQGGCECSSGQLKCHNGKCVAKELFRDGQDDCGDGTDEPEQSSCSHYLARVQPSRLCDGVLHCKDRSDEDPMFCKCFAKKNFQCNRDHSNVDLCVAPDVVCDGVKDCPNGEDERTCIALSSPEGSTYGTGQVIVRSHGVWHVKCYATQNHTKTELEEICKELGFISGHAEQLKQPSHLPKPFNNLILDSFNDVKLNNKTSISLRNTNEPIAKPIVDDKIENCYPVYIECL